MVQISTNNSNNNISVSTPNNTVSVSMTDSTAKYYSNLAEKSANNAQNSAQSAEVSAEVAKTYSKNLQPDWIESDTNSSAYIKNKPNVIYTSGDGISVENNVISNTNTSATWGNINGTLSNQTDLQNTITNLSDKDLSNISDIAKEVIKQNAVSSHNIGEVVTSTIPLTDAGLHLLDGSLIEYGSYSAFVDYIATVYTSTPILFCTEAEWQTAVSTYGVCGKFVYDSTSKTVRLPKTSSNKRYLVQTGTNSYNGTWALYSDGWYEEGGNLSITSNINIKYNRSFLNTDYNLIAGDFNTDSDYDAGRGGAYYSTKTISGFTYIKYSSACYFKVSGYTAILTNVIENKYRYIVVATSAKTAIQVNIDNIVSDLNAKADKSELNGSWVQDIVALSSTLAIGTYTIDLSDILPKDGKNYECLFESLIASTGAHQQDLSSDIFPNITAIGYVDSGSTQSRNLFPFPVGAGRTVTLIKSSSNASAASNLRLIGYRRVM